MNQFPTSACIGRRFAAPNDACRWAGNILKPMYKLISYQSVGSINFDDDINSVKSKIGPGYTETVNRLKMIEIRMGNITYRFSNDMLIELTISVQTETIVVNEEVIVDIRNWIVMNDEKYMDIRGFRVSEKYGLAVDLDDERYVYITIFKRGSWDPAILRYLKSAQQANASDAASRRP